MTNRHRNRRRPPLRPNRRRDSALRFRFGPAAPGLRIAISILLVMLAAVNNTKAEKTPVDPELHRRVLDLIQFKGGGHNEDCVADIIENALKLLQDVKDTGDVRVIQTAVRELRYAFKFVRALCGQAQGDDVRLRPHGPDKRSISRPSSSAARL
jgi:hypothetical protein